MSVLQKCSRMHNHIKRTEIRLNVEIIFDARWLVPFYDRPILEQIAVEVDVDKIEYLFRNVIEVMKKKKDID